MSLRPFLSKATLAVFIFLIHPRLFLLGKYTVYVLHVKYYLLCITAPYGEAQLDAFKLLSINPKIYLN